MSSDDRTDTLRAQLQAAAPSLGSLLIDTLAEALQTTKRAWSTCPNCNKRVEVHVQDATAAVNAAKTLLEQAEGKPGTASEQDHGPSVVIMRAVNGNTQQEGLVTALVPVLAGCAEPLAGARAGDADLVSQAPSLEP